MEGFLMKFEEESVLSAHPSLDAATVQTYLCRNCSGLTAPALKHWLILSLTVELLKRAVSFLKVSVAVHISAYMAIMRDATSTWMELHEKM
jgi:hypothetical protein